MFKVGPFWETQVSCSMVESEYKDSIPQPTFSESTFVGSRYLPYKKPTAKAETPEALFHKRLGMCFSLLSVLWPVSSRLPRTFSLVCHVAPCNASPSGHQTRRLSVIPCVATTKTRVPDIKSGAPNMYKVALLRDVGSLEHNKRRV